MRSRDVGTLTTVVFASWMIFAPGRSLGYEAGPVNGGGTIKGVVRFGAAYPPPQTLEVTKDFQVCGKEKPDEEFIVSPETKGLKNVVVSLVGMSRGKEFPRTTPTLTQKGCQYVPHVLVVPPGGSVKVLNEDGILHNIHTYSQANTPINMAQPAFKRELNVSFGKSETVKVACDVHDWMTARIVVQEHPYYALTDDNGHFELTDVPPGTYSLHAWHEGLGEMTKQVTVKAGQVSDGSFEIVPK